MHFLLLHPLSLSLCVQTEISSHEARINSVSSTGEAMTTQGHYGAPDIKIKISSLNSVWTRLKELSQLRQQALEDALKAQQYFSDAQEAESWMKEKEPVVSSVDFGKDEDSAQVCGVWCGCVVWVCGMWCGCVRILWIARF